MTMEKADLRHAAGDLVAGDLDAADAEAFRRLAADEPALGREVAFWERVRPALAATPVETTPPLGAGFTAAVLARAARERQEQAAAPRQVVLRLPPWAMAAVASAAAAALVVLLLRPSAPAGRMYLEDGAQVVLERGDWQEYSPLALVNAIERGDPALAAADHHARSWLGMWSRPVTVVESGRTVGEGILVLRVAHGSPAHAAGLRPGDVIRSLAGCPVSTAQCIGARLEQCKPGDVLWTVWDRPRTGEQFRREIRVEAVYE